MHDWTRETYEASDRRNWTNRDEKEFWIDMTPDAFVVRSQPWKQEGEETMRPGDGKLTTAHDAASAKLQPGLSSLLITFLLIGLSGAIMGAAVTLLVQGLMK